MILIGVILLAGFVGLNVVAAANWIGSYLFG